MKTIYIAGKVTGEQIASCTLKFGTAQKKLEDLGYNVVNPLAVVNDWHSTWENAMRKCIKALMECDAIYALPCCGDSNGASIELGLASSLNMPVYLTIKSINPIIKTIK